MPTLEIAAAPGGLPLLGHALRLRNDPLGFFTSLPQYGEIVQIRLGPERAFVVSSAELAREVLVVQPRKFDKGAQIKNARGLIGNGLLSSEGDVHKQQRRLMQPAFRRERIAEYAQTMREQIVARTDAWHSGKVLDVRVEMTAMTLAVTAKTLISAEPGKDLVAEMQHNLPRLLDLMYQQLTTPLAALNKLPLPRNREYAAGLARLHSMIDTVIADYRQSENPRHDLLSILLEETDEETEKGLSDTEIHDQITTILVAGSETTAATLAWVFGVLAEHPEVEARLHAEVDDVLDGRPAEYADVRRLAYTAQVISEALRCFPPAWIITRRATQDLELKGYPIPKGASVIVSPYIVQRDPRLFADPEKFDPDRWLPERAAQIPRDAIIQFGNGPRKCIGDVFAIVEGTLALATIAARWRLRAEPGTTMEKIAASTYTPRNLFLTAELRRA
ncbi:cytochrome P450 [Nocardia sp. NPDC049220]|uniref:cytochrome P450 n=1 Tax=Nocardia sp. NPDC049220 TaxID=3155273 RepID=UPI0033EF31E2